MSDLLYLGSTGVSAYQRALATVSSNIANVNTEGYSRQEVTLGSTPSRPYGTSFIGTGTRLESVRRQYDAYVESRVRNSNSDLQRQQPLLAYQNRLIDMMGGESTGVTPALNQFFEAARDLASDPASQSARTLFLRDAEGLAAGIRQLAGQFGLLDDETRQAIETDLGGVNALTAQLAVVNRQLARQANLERQPPELLDRRDLLLRELSGLTAIRTRFEANGSVTVSVGETFNRGVLVEGLNARTLGVVRADNGRLGLVIDPYGTPETLAGLGNGSIGGTLAFREQVLSPAQQALDQLATVLAEEVNTLHRNGLDADGRNGGDLFGFGVAATDSTTAVAGSLASRLQCLVTDIGRVAAAGPFRVIHDPLNTGTEPAHISWSEPGFAGPSALAGELALAQPPHTASLTLTIPASQGQASLGLIPLGTRDLVLTLHEPAAGQNLQVLTRDGRHLLGSALDRDLQTALLKTTNGMEDGAQYSTASLNASGTARHLDMDLFLGARAAPGQLQQFGSAGEVLAPLPVPAVLNAGSFDSSWSGPVAADTFTLNGVSLPALGSAGPITLEEVVNWFNDSSASTGVSATVVEGRLQLARASDNTRDDIRLGPGGAGSPAELKRLGFDTSLHLRGAAADDLLVFVTDGSGLQTKATVSAQFSTGNADLKEALRAQTLEVVFSSDTDYTITERSTGTVVAERSLSPGADGILYRGLNLRFASTPAAGDRFLIDGNQDGIGNNEAMLALIALQDEGVMPGGLNLAEAYIEQVSRVGNLARQAAISVEALTVVHEQAVEAREGIAGVNLDQEAAALVRFQQAYQANARVMQVAGTLFDAILQVR